MAPNLDTQARDPAATEATETRDAAVQIWPVALTVPLVDEDHCSLLGSAPLPL